MNMNGNIFIALLHSREPVGGPLLVVAKTEVRSRTEMSATTKSWDDGDPIQNFVSQLADYRR
jgi:hypothetical protein